MQAVCIVIFSFSLALVGALNIDAPVQQTLEAGSEGTIVCAAKVVGQEVIGQRVWRGKDYNQIQNGGRYSIGPGGLTISNVQPGDSGFYVCEVRLAAANNHNHGMFYHKFIDVTVV